MLRRRFERSLKEISSLAGATDSSLSVNVWNTTTHIELNVRVVIDESVES